jgi:hypothetical protein
LIEAIVEHHNKMILLPHQHWIFFTYIEDGTDVIEEWVESLSFEAQIAFEKMLKGIYKVENHLEWLSYRHKLKGRFRKIWELDVPATNLASRVLCVFNGEKRAVMLCGCFHKGSAWTPSNALEVALGRAHRVENGTAKLNIKKIESHI